MKLFWKIFGGLYALFGTIVAVLDVLDWANMVTVFPQPPNYNEIIYSHIFVFFVGVSFAILGGYIFKNT